MTSDQSLICPLKVNQNLVATKGGDVLHGELSDKMGERLIDGVPSILNEGLILCCDNEVGL